MYYLNKDGKVQGVLCDFDLSTTDGKQSKNRERTGTMPYMALDLLENATALSEVIHIYRHDSESFLWTIADVMHTYDDGVCLREKSPCYRAWRGVDYATCRGRKLGWLTRDKPEYELASSHREDHPWLLNLANHYGLKVVSQWSLRFGGSGVLPQTDLDEFKSFFVLIHAGDKEQLLSYLESGVDAR